MTNARRGLLDGGPAARKPSEADVDLRFLHAELPARSRFTPARTEDTKQFLVSSDRGRRHARSPSVVLAQASLLGGDEIARLPLPWKTSLP